jgi:hypothetical protein
MLVFRTANTAQRKHTEEVLPEGEPLLVEDTMMKAFFTWILLPLFFLPVQVRTPDSSSLELVSLGVKEKYVEVSMINRSEPIKLPGVPNMIERYPGRPDLQGRDTNSRNRGISRPQMGVRPLVKVYSLKLQLKNKDSRTIEKFVWELPEAEGTPAKEFLCKKRIELSETVTVTAVAPLQRQKVVDVSKAGSKPDLPKPSAKDIVIDQIQFIDGSVWQRSTWNSTILLTRSSARKVGKGKCIPL